MQNTFKKAWLIPSSNVVIEAIGNDAIGVPARLMPEPYSIYQHPINDNTYLVDNNETEFNPEPEKLSYQLPGLPESTIVESISIQGIHPENETIYPPTAVE